MTKRYRLVEEDKLRRLIEGNILYDELCAAGVDNWIGLDFVHFPDADEIDAELNEFDKSGEDKMKRIKNYEKH